MSRNPDRKLELLLAVSAVGVSITIIIPLIAVVSTKQAAGQAMENLDRLSQAMALYCADAEDRFPVGDGCVPGSSLNPAHRGPLENRGEFAGCVQPTYNRVDWKHWQKWLVRYVRDDRVFENPLRERDDLMWTVNGVLNDGFVLNLGLTGAREADIRGGYDLRRWNSWRGGARSGIRRPESAALILDLPSFDPALPVLTGESDYRLAYPAAVREYYTYVLMNGRLDDCAKGVRPSYPDRQKAPLGGLNLVAVDGGARFLTVGAFFAATPELRSFGFTSAMVRGSSLACRPLQPQPRPVVELPEVRPPAGFPLWDLE